MVPTMFSLQTVPADHAKDAPTATITQSRGQNDSTDVLRPVVTKPTDVVTAMLGTAVRDTAARARYGDVPEVEARRILGHGRPPDLSTR
jgi:hypothetical protein